MKFAMVAVVGLALSACSEGQNTNPDFAMPFTLAGTYTCFQTIDQFCAASATSPQPPCGQSFDNSPAVMIDGAFDKWQCNGYTVTIDRGEDFEWDFVYENAQLVAVVYRQFGPDGNCEGGPPTLTLSPGACSPFIPPTTS